VKLVRLQCFAFLLTAAFTFPQICSAQSANFVPQRDGERCEAGCNLGAELTLSNPQTGFSRTMKTDGQGDYRFLQVPPSSLSAHHRRAWL